MSCHCSSQLAPIYKGDNATVKIQVLQPDGTYMNFNGRTVKFIIKQNKTSEDEKAIVYREMSPTEDITELEVVLTQQETDVNIGTYWYGVRIITNEYQTTEGEGQVEIKQGPFHGK